jgi:hypothetical protein
VQFLARSLPVGYGRASSAAHWLYTSSRGVLPREASELHPSSQSTSGKRYPSSNLVTRTLGLFGMSISWCNENVDIMRMVWCHRGNKRFRCQFACNGDARIVASEEEVEAFLAAVLLASSRNWMTRARGVTMKRWKSNKISNTYTTRMNERTSWASVWSYNSISEISSLHRLASKVSVAVASAMALHGEIELGECGQVNVVDSSSPVATRFLFLSEHTTTKSLGSEGILAILSWHVIQVASVVDSFPARTLWTMMTNAFTVNNTWESWQQSVTMYKLP